MRRRLAILMVLAVGTGLVILPGSGRFLAMGQELGPAGTPSRGVQSIQGIDGMRPVDVKQGGSSDAWTIQAVHQAVVSHISSMSHVVIVDLPRWAHIQVSHITSVTHVASAGGGFVTRDDTCTTCRMRVDHYNALANQPHISGAIRAFQVAQCGTTATIAVATNANRRDIYLRNITSTGPLAADGANIFVGQGVTGHVALTAANGWVLHAAAHMASNTLILPNYSGPISCIGTTAGATLSILEILR